MVPKLDPNPLDHDAAEYDDLDFEEGDPPPSHRPTELHRRPRTKRGTLSLPWADAEMLEAEAKQRSTSWRRITYMAIVQELVAAHCKKQRDEQAAKKTAKAAAKAKPSKPKKPAKAPGKKTKKGGGR
jgi:hypothetical protein